MNNKEYNILKEISRIIDLAKDTAKYGKEHINQKNLLTNKLVYIQNDFTKAKDSYNSELATTQIQLDEEIQCYDDAIKFFIKYTQEHLDEIKKLKSISN